MKVEGKEISVFSFMFAAGCALGLQTAESESVCMLSFTFSILLAAISKLQLPALKHTSKILKIGNVSDSTALIPAFFFAGLSGSIASSFPGAPQADWFLPKAASVSSAYLKECIDSIPFKDKCCNAIVKAFITGDRSDLPHDLTEAFRKSGASHLLALSGMHLGVIYIILSRILSILGNSPFAIRIRSATCICSAGFYTIITGAGPSIVRAFLFIFLNESAKCMGRKTAHVNTFCSALMIQLVLNPENIVSAGFQLSYLAMAGIYFLYPHIEKWYSSIETITGRIINNTIEKTTVKKGVMQILWNATALSVSCQIFTAPAAWIHFRSFPEYFLITNLTATPLTTVVINASIPAIILQATGLCPEVLVKTSEWMIHLLTESIKTIGSL